MFDDVCKPPRSEKNEQRDLNCLRQLRLCFRAFRVDCERFSFVVRLANAYSGVEDFVISHRNATVQIVCERPVSSASLLRRPEYIVIELFDFRIDYIRIAGAAFIYCGSNLIVAFTAKSNAVILLKTMLFSCHLLFLFYVHDSRLAQTLWVTRFLRCG